MRDFHFYTFILIYGGPQGPYKNISLSVSFRSLNVSKLEMVAGKDAELALVLVVVAALLITPLVAPTCNILFPHFGQKRYDFKSIQSHFLQEAAITKHARRIAKRSIIEPRPWSPFLESPENFRAHFG